MPIIEFTETEFHTHNGINALPIQYRDLRDTEIIVVHSLQGTAVANSNMFGNIFIAPFKCRMESVRESHRVAASAGTLQVEKLTPGTAKGSGTNLLATTIDFTTGANQVQSRSGTTLVTNINSLNLAVNDRLGLTTSGSLASLQDVIFVIKLIKT